MYYGAKGDVRNTWIGVGVVFGKCEDGLESVIKSLDPSAEVDSLTGVTVYHLSNLRLVSALRHVSPLTGAFKATVVYYGSNGTKCRDYNVCISVTSDSLTLLNELINTIVRKAHIQVVSYYPNVLNLNSGSGSRAQLPTNVLSSPGFF